MRFLPSDTLRTQDRRSGARGRGLAHGWQAALLPGHPPVQLEDGGHGGNHGGQTDEQAPLAPTLPPCLGVGRGLVRPVGDGDDGVAVGRGLTADYGDGVAVSGDHEVHGVVHGLFGRRLVLRSGVEEFADQVRPGRCVPR